MGYEDGEAAILVLVRAASDWDNATTSRGDWLILNSGKSRKYVILKPGEELSNEIISIGHKTRVTIYETVVEIWNQFDTIGTDLQEIEELRSDLLNQLEKYPNLGKGIGNAIRSAIVRQGGEIEEKWSQGKGPHWYYCELIIEWTEETQISSSET